MKKIIVVLALISSSLGFADITVTNGASRPIRVTCQDCIKKTKTTKKIKNGKYKMFLSSNDSVLKFTYKNTQYSTEDKVKNGTTAQISVYSDGGYHYIGMVYKTPEGEDRNESYRI